MSEQEQGKVSQPQAGQEQQQASQQDSSQFISCVLGNISSFKYKLPVPDWLKDNVENFLKHLIPDWLDWVVDILVPPVLDIVGDLVGTLAYCADPRLWETLNAYLSGVASPVSIDARYAAACLPPGGEATLSFVIRNRLKSGELKVKVCYDIGASGVPNCSDTVIGAGDTKTVYITVKAPVASGTYPVALYVADEVGVVLAKAIGFVIVPDLDEVCGSVLKEVAAKSQETSTLLTLAVLAMALK